MLSITVTCLYNFDSLKPHFYTVKLGFTGVYIIFLIFAQKHRLWVRNLCFEQKYENYQSFLSENVQFLEVKFSMYLNRRVFVIRGKKKKTYTRIILLSGAINAIHKNVSSGSSQQRLHGICKHQRLRSDYTFLSGLNLPCPLQGLSKILRCSVNQQVNRCDNVGTNNSTFKPLRLPLLC